MTQKKGKKNSDSREIEAVDLIALLTPPGMEGYYDNEITENSLYNFDEDQSYEAVSPEIASEKVKSKEQKPEKPQQKSVEQKAVKPSMPKPKSKPAPRNLTDEELLSSIKKERHSEEKPKPVIPEIVLVENDSLEKISAEIAECTKCELHKTRNKTVPGAGPQKTKLVFIGEAPGADEDATGIPFVGKAGKHLDKVISAAGFKREEVFICNILKCRPPGNRDPVFSEMVCCTPYLQRQLAILQPKIIACLGNVAIRYVVGPKTPGITKIHGQWFDSIFGIPTMAMFHPSYLIRSESRAKGSPNWLMWQDVQALKKRYDSV